MSKKWLSIILVVLFFGGCEINTTISLDGNYPPTFRLHGSGGISYVQVRDVTDPESMEGQWWIKPGIWRVAPVDGDIYISKIPPLTYGVVPPGFVQKMPKKGPPPTLAEGKVYEVWAPTFDAPGSGRIIFEVRDGRTQTVY